MGLVAGGPAGAQEAASFPGSLESEALLGWLQRETDIRPDRVVAYTSQSLTSIEPTAAAGAGQGPRAVIRAEALAPDTVARTGSLSWRVSVTADCPGRRLRLGETLGYARRNLRGEQRRLREADTGWRTPEARTALEYAWRSLCEPAFRGPFQGVEARTARAAGTSAPPAPAQTPVQPEVQALEPRPAAERPGGFVAQLGAAPSKAEAESVLLALSGRLHGRRTWVEAAEVGGRTWHRALVGGFADAAQAQAFCAEMKAARRACFVRKPG